MYKYVGHNMCFPATINTIMCCLFIFIPALSILVSEGAIVTDIQTALNLGNASINYTREQCIWRANNDPTVCPDPGLKLILYTSKNQNGELVDFNQADWLQHSSWVPNLDNVVLIHGYAGGDNIFPMSMLRDAYIQNGSYNVIVVDWGGMANLPCYPAAVHNIRTAARCTAPMFALLRDADPGGITKTTCVGHSLGAHVCGLISDYLRFRVHRVIGLDPARPLIRNAVSLKPGSADIVQIVHSNAGTYGESGKMGKIDFCLNGGKTQPECDKFEKADLCSHVSAICFMSASISENSAPKAHPCGRRCPSGPRPTHRLGVPVLMGQHTPQSASGFYCVSTKTPPYCAATPDAVGHPWCCLDKRSQQQTLETIAPPLTDTEEPQKPQVHRDPTFKFHSK